MDRNYGDDLTFTDGTVSLSARRAWIEIFEKNYNYCRRRSLSARRAWIEIGVDFAQEWLDAGSLSARRAWIEIWCVPPFVCLCRLSLSARRAWIEIVISAMTSQISVSRSPQGERG